VGTLVHQVMRCAILAVYLYGEGVAKTPPA
jgi:hypothetical protein